MRAKENSVLGAETFQDKSQVRIVISVSVLDSFLNGRLATLFLRKPAFFAHVSSSDELDAKVVS